MNIEKRGSETLDAQLNKLRAQALSEMQESGDDEMIRKTVLDIRHDRERYGILDDFHDISNEIAYDETLRYVTRGLLGTYMAARNEQEAEGAREFAATLLRHLGLQESTIDNIIRTAVRKFAQ